MDRRNFRTFSTVLKIIGYLILMFGLFWYGAGIGAGVYNHDDDQLGESIQFLTISIGIAIGFFLVASVFDKMVSDMKHEELMEKLEERGRRRHRY